MANDFLTNLRASRGSSRTETPNRAPTRGDIQKQKQEESSPGSFTNFLRLFFGMPELTKGKKQISVEEAPAYTIDRLSPENADLFIEQQKLNRQNAKSGTLNLENNLDKYNAAVNGGIDIPSGFSEFENAYGVLNNYEKLNKLLDDYDAINTWSGKQRFLENSYKTFDDKYGDIGRWFNKLYGYTKEAQQIGEWDTRNVSNVMRRINNNIRNMLLKQS